MLSTDVTQSDDVITELGDTGRVLIAELEDAHALKADAEARIERVRAALETLMTQDGATGAKVNGQPVLTWKPVTSRRLNQSRVRQALSAEAFEACFDVTESRPFKRVQ